MGIDPNRLMIVLAVLILAGMAGAWNYRLEIGTEGLKFETNSAKAFSRQVGSP
jgi:hypothetical protein